MDSDLNCTMTYISVMFLQEKMSNKVVALKVRLYVDISKLSISDFPN